MKLLLALALALACAAFNSPAQSLPAHYRVTNNLPYVTGGQARQWMDLYYVPSNAAPTPVVVWVHGGGWASENENNPRALAHEAGHFFDLCHTFGCSCNPCDNPESDGILDTLRHTSSESEDDIAQRAYGTTFDNLTAAQQQSVANTHLNIMSYYSDPIRITSDQLDKQTDTSNGARLDVASGRTRFVDYQNNGQFPNGASAKTLSILFPTGTGGPYPTLAQGVFWAGANDIVLIRSGTYAEGLTLDRPSTLRATRGNAILR